MLVITTPGRAPERCCAAFGQRRALQRNFPWNHASLRKAAPIHHGDPVLAVFPTTDSRLAEREFVVAEFDDGTETIDLDEVTDPAPQIRDMDRIAPLGWLLELNGGGSA